MAKATVKTSRKRGTVSQVKVRKAVKTVFARAEAEAKVSKRVQPVNRPVKTAYLTPQEFLKLPLSAAILQVIEDVKVLHRKGIKFNMSSWWIRGRDNAEPCSVCLGGAALCSFAPAKVNGYTVQQYSDRVLRIDYWEQDRIARTFNDLRLGLLPSAFMAWHKTCLFPAGLGEIVTWFAGKGQFMGRIGITRLRKLLENLAELSAKLEAIGY